MSIEVSRFKASICTFSLFPTINNVCLPIYFRISSNCIAPIANFETDLLSPALPASIWPSTIFAISLNVKLSKFSLLRFSILTVPTLSIVATIPS